MGLMGPMPLLGRYRAGPQRAGAKGLWGGASDGAGSGFWFICWGCSGGEVELLEEVVEGLFPFRGVVGVVGDVPCVRDGEVVEAGVHGLADAEETVFGAAGEPDEFGGFEGGGVGDEVGGFFGVRGGGEAADP